MDRATLRQNIIQLELRQQDELQLLKEQARLTYESIKPVNLIRDTIHEAVNNSEVQGDALNGAIGMGVGYIAKQLISGASKNPLTNIAGTILQVGLSNFVARHPERIKSFGQKLLNMFEKKEPVESEIKPAKTTSGTIPG